jgi:hypothetical protein
MVILHDVHRLRKVRRGGRTFGTKNPTPQAMKQTNGICVDQEHIARSLKITFLFRGTIVEFKIKQLHATFVVATFVLKHNFMETCCCIPPERCMN